MRRNAGLEPSRRRRKEREKCAEEKRGEGRERQRHGAEGVQADVDPRHAGAEEPEAEGIPGPESAPRRRAHPEMHQKGEREERERKEAKRREREHRRRAREKRRQINRRQTLFYVLGLSTNNVYTRRESARSTWKRTPSITTVSPRLGSRPRCEMTSPPLVSTVSSGSAEPSALLRSAIWVSAFTR